MNYEYETEYRVRDIDLLGRGGEYPFCSPILLFYPYNTRSDEV